MSTDNAAMAKLTIIPIEGDGSAISTMYNPKELSFTKSVGWTDDSVGCGTDFPAIYFTAGKAITFSVELFFDYYEQKGDVRGVVNQLIHLCEIQPIKGKEKRPPQVKLVWGPGAPVGAKDFLCVVEQVVPKYTMFLSNGTPCRASVTVNLKQADVIGTQTMNDKGELQREYDTDNMTVAQAADIPGMREEIEKNGGKIEDKSTWPSHVALGQKTGDDKISITNNVNVEANASASAEAMAQAESYAQNGPTNISIENPTTVNQNVEITDINIGSGYPTGNYGYGYGMPVAVVPVVPVVPVAPVPVPPKPGPDNDDWQYGHGQGKVD